MGFTTDEVQQVVQQLVSTTIRRPYGALGTRQLDVPFADYQNAAASVFLLAPRAPFYVLSLASQQLMETVTAEAVLVQNLLDAVTALSNKTYPITDLTGLANAGAALNNLSNASSARTTAFGDLGKVPAFQQFINSTNAFLQSAGSNVKLNGQLVQTPQQARAAIPGFMSKLKVAHQKLDQLVQQLAQGMDNYNAVNLPSLVATSVIANAHGMLQSQLGALSALTPDQRLEMIRQVVIELCASQAAVKQFASFSGPTPYLTVDGIGTLFADADHSATPALTFGDAPGPYSIYSGRNVVDVFVDMAYALNLPPGSLETPLLKYTGATTNILPLGFGSGLITIIGADFPAAGVIVGSVVYVNDGTNINRRWLVSQVVGPTQLQVTATVPVLSDGSAHIEVYVAPTASLLLGNSLVPELKGGIDESYVITMGVNQVLMLSTLDYNAILSATVTIPPGTFNADETAGFINLGLVGSGMNLQAAGYFGTKKFGDYVNISVLGPTSARFTFLMGTPSQFNLKVGDMVAWPNGITFTRWTITALGMTWVDTTSTTFILGPSLNVYVEMGANRRVRFFCPDVAAALGVREQITIVDDPTAAGALNTLGFFPGSFMRARPTTAKEVANNINIQATSFVAGTLFKPILDTTARTEPFDPRRIVFSKWQGMGDITQVTGPGPYTVTLVATTTPPSTVRVGDALVVRTGFVLNMYFTITDITGNTFTMTGAIGLLESGVAIEVGPYLTAPYGTLINIPGGANGGDYYVEQQQNPIDLLLQQALPLSNNLGQSIDLGVCSIGTEHVTLASKRATTDSHIFVREPFALLTTMKAVQGFMSTPWFKMPAIPQALEGGDLLEFYVDHYNTPSVSYEIDEIEGLLLRVDPEIAPGFLSYTFSETTVVPFARLRAGKVVNWQAFEDQLNTWLGVFPVAPYFTALNALVNPLLINRTSTAVQINNARNKLLGLAGLLTIAGAQAAHSDPAFALESILDSYSVDPVASVDTLFNAFAERGLDRSLDLLLAAQFQEFFSLTADTGSYTGNLLATARAVAQKDIPVSSSTPQQLTSQLTQVSSSPDFEYDTTDGNTGPNNTPPETNS